MQLRSLATASEVVYISSRDGVRSIPVLEPLLPRWESKAAHQTPYPIGQSKILISGPALALGSLGEPTLVPQALVEANANAEYLIC